MELIAFPTDAPTNVPAAIPSGPNIIPTPPPITAPLSASDFFQYSDYSLLACFKSCSVFYTFYSVNSVKLSIAFIYSP